jgi:hypothetical protein
MVAHFCHFAHRRPYTVCYQLHFGMQVMVFCNSEELAENLMGSNEKF